MQFNSLRLKPQTGFTLIEMMVVITIMALFAFALSVNLTAGRANRDLRQAENRLVSDIRKIQAYNLASKTLPSGNSAQYYILKLDLAKPGQYTIQAIYNASAQPKLEDVETVTLPANVQISLLQVGSRPQAPVLQPSITGCMLAAFVAPFGKIIFNDGCAIASAPSLQLLDDYYDKIINFPGNQACSGAGYIPPACSASTDSRLGIFLRHTSGALADVAVMINSVSGSVCPMDAATWICKTSY